MIKSKEIDNIKILVNISDKIKEIYIQLEKSEIQEDATSYQENLTKLKMLSNFENEIYQRLNPTPFTLENTLKRINIIAKQQHPKNNDFIITRIQNYIIFKMYPNPFLSMQEDLDKQSVENIQAISNQLDKDYLLKFLNLLEEKIKGETNPYLKESLISLRYLNVYWNKQTEENYFYHNLTQPIIGRERCLLFNQDEDLVYQICAEKYYNIFIENIYDALAISNEDLESSLDNIFKLEVHLLIAEAVLSLSEKEEIGKMYMNFYTYIIKNKQMNKIKADSSISYNRIRNLLTFFINQKVKTKKK